MMLEDLQQVAAICATLGGLFLAANGINTWKREVIGRRDMEVCQKLIETFYEAQQLVSELRNPLSYNSESEGRKKDEDETNDRAMHLDTTYVPVARWNAQTQFWTGFHSQRWRAKAILGEPVLEPFAIVDGVVHKFRVAASARYRAA